MEQLSQVKEGLTNLGSQLGQGVQLTGGIVSAVILQLITVIDMLGMAERERELCASNGSRDQDIA